MNFVFDIGNVLIQFKPLPFLENLFPKKSVQAKMYETIFQSPEWEQLDRGLISQKEALDIFFAREPDFQLSILKAMENVTDMLTPVSDTVALLPKIKERGHSLYYLSNCPAEIRDYLLEKYAFFTLFDGGVFSCDVYATKPSPAIYRHFLEKYQLDPKDCVFFDDMAENVTAARQEGMQAVQFTDAGCVLPFLPQYIR